MSSMVNNLRIKALPLKALSCTVLAGLALATPSSAQNQPVATVSQPVTQQIDEMGAAISKWELLQKSRQLGFFDYSGFALAYPDFPRMGIIRVRAENALATETVPRVDVLRYFDALPPLTNAGRARYAMALAGDGRAEALEVAREAWRGGQMAESIELTLESLYDQQFTVEDHAARMDALLWQGDRAAATRQMSKLAPPDQKLVMARLALLGGTTPEAAGVELPRRAFQDAGFLYNQVSYLRKKGQWGEASAVLANRTSVNAPAFDGEEMVGLMLAVAKKSPATNAVRIASRIDDLFEPGADISQGSFPLRDRYTDLMWLGGTKALWDLKRPDQAIGLFERYGKAARSPLTRAKGFYWAGRAAQAAGNADEATRLYETASQWPEYYYSQLALAALDRPMPQFAQLPALEVTAEDRAAFEARPVVRALITMAGNRRKWQTERRFFQAIGDAVANETEMVMAHQLAERLNLPEMSVVLGFKAGERDFKGLERIGFPVVATPTITDWSITHAVTRQESEFDRTRISHANARGMMQLLRSTAREQARMTGVQYNASWLLERPQYNIQLGDGYFNRQLKRYGGAYPLAAGAYNAGGGRINQWLALNGDPRRGDTDWVTWVEQIPSRFETRYYIMRVIGNAVTYSHMYPDKAGLPRDIEFFLK